MSVWSFALYNQKIKVSLICNIIWRSVTQADYEAAALIISIVKLLFETSQEIIILTRPNYDGDHYWPILTNFIQVWIKWLISVLYPCV